MCSHHMQFELYLHIGSALIKLFIAGVQACHIWSKRARNVGYFNLHDHLEGNRYSLYILVVFPRTTNFKDH